MLYIAPGGTLPLTYSSPQPPTTTAATLPFTARPGSPGRASQAGTGSTAPGGLRYTLQRFFASRERRAAMDAACAQQRLETSMQNFILRWSRRQIDELVPRTGAKLLKTACNDTLSLGAGTGGSVDHRATAAPASIPADTRSATQSDTGGEADANVATRERANTYDDMVGAALGPAKAALNDAIRPCLARLALTELSLLYNDLRAPSQAVRSLIDYQPEKLRAIAAGMLDLVEHGTARELATRLGNLLLNRLIDTTARRPPEPEAVRSTLEELRGIGQWLSSPTRPDTEVLNLILDSLTDDALGKLTAQAWPELTARDERYGEDAVAMAAAVMFIGACDGDALQLWRDALRTQLRRRKRVVAVRAAEKVRRASGPERLAGAMHVVHGVLDDTAHTLTGHWHNVSVLRARIRDEALALALQYMPAPLRFAVLRSLRPHDLSSLKSSLDSSVDMTHLRTTVGSNVDAVRDDILNTSRRAMEGKLASLHEALATGDRAAALIRFGALGHATGQLKETLKAFDASMPDLLVKSLEEAVTRMRAHLLDDEGDRDEARTLHALSDIELGQLRRAIGPLAPFGSVVDKRGLIAEIRARAVPPGNADEAMDRLMDTCADDHSTIFEILARLRDISDILVRHNERLFDLGEEICPDDHAKLASDVVRSAHRRYTQRDSNGQTRLRDAMARHPGITGSTLCEVLWLVADFATGRPPEESMRLNRIIAALGLAGRLEGNLHEACMGDEDFGAGPLDTNTRPAGDLDEDTAGRADLRMAIAGEFGLEWDEMGGTVTPGVTHDHHLLFKRYLITHPSADAASARPIRLPLEDGEASWFSVSEGFARDVLWQPGISLAVEGVSARGHRVHYPGFDPALRDEARLAAAGAAMHALRALAGDATLALTRLMHRGALDGFATALSRLPENSPLKLPDGRRVQIPDATPDITEFHIERHAAGHYHIETTLTYSCIDIVISRDSSMTAHVTIPLDPACSRVKATFGVATDAMGENASLSDAVDIRYRLVPLEDTTNL